MINTVCEILKYIHCINIFSDTKSADSSPDVVVMTYARYCRYRCMLKRLDGSEDKWMRNALVAALGGFAAEKDNNRVYFCRDIFEHADLDDFELRCDHLGNTSFVGFASFVIETLTSVYNLYTHE